MPFELTTQFTITFMFTFAIVFGVIDLTGIFRKNRVVTAIIALAMAAFSSMYAPFSNLLWSYLPNLTWFFIIMFLFAFIFKVLGVRRGADATENMVIIGVILFILLAAGWMILQEFPVEIPIIGTGDNLIFLIGIIFIVMIFWYAMKAGPMQVPQQS